MYDCCKNFSYSFELQKFTRISKRKIARLKRQEAYVNPIEQVRAYQKMMKTEGLNQSQLAEKLKISRVRVHQLFSLLKLPQDQQKHILKHGKEKIITERKLRNKHNHFG